MHCKVDQRRYNRYGAGWRMQAEWCTWSPMEGSPAPAQRSHRSAARSVAAVALRPYSVQAVSHPQHSAVARGERRTTHPRPFRWHDRAGSQISKREQQCLPWSQRLQPQQRVECFSARAAGRRHNQPWSRVVRPGGGGRHPRGGDAAAGDADCGTVQYDRRQRRRRALSATMGASRLRIDPLRPLR